MAYHGADPKPFDNRDSERGAVSRIAMTISLCLAIAGVAGMAGEAGAQFLQYTPPGGPEQRPESRKEEMEREIEQADRRLGRVHVAPWASLSDVAYVRNLFSSSGQQMTNDFTATVGAGFRAYLRNGPKAVWRAQVLPEYVWWREQADRRQLNGRYTLGFHGFFNRMTLEVQGGREQRQRVVTPEVPVPVSARNDLGEVLAEVELSHAFFAFTAASVNRQENLVDEADDPRVEGISLLDREDRISRVGLRWQPREYWSVALGAERTESAFDRGLFDRSNRGTAPVAEARYEGRRLDFSLALAARSLEAPRGSAFVPFDGVTGGAAVTLGREGRLSSSLYASRNLLYSLSPNYAYLLDERVGLALGVGIRQRTEVRFFAETGVNDYTPYRTFPGAPPGTPGPPRREEDVTSYGVSTSLRLSRRASIGLQAIRLEADSNLPGGDRSYTTVGTTIHLSETTFGDP
jgi:hypothetical protein